MFRQIKLPSSTIYDDMGDNSVRNYSVHQNATKSDTSALETAKCEFIAYLPVFYMLSVSYFYCI